MKTFLIILTFILSILIHISGVFFLSFYEANLNFVLIFSFILVVHKEFKKTWWAFLAIGFLLDLFSGLPFGVISFSLICSCFLVDWLNRTIFSDPKFWIVVILALIGIFSYHFTLLVLSKIFLITKIESMAFVYSDYSFWKLALKMIMTLIYNAVFVSIIFYAVKKIFYQKANS